MNLQVLTVVAVLTMLAPLYAASGGYGEPAAIRERVTFTSEGSVLVGVLYRPAGIDPNARVPVVVVAPPWLNVKEQVAVRWAEALSDRGVAALAFDYRYWGESGGEPREWESASAKVRDLRAAVAYLGTRPDVDPARVGGLGVCFGAGHMFLAASDNPAIGSIATVAAWLHDRPSVVAVFGQEEVDRRYAAARDAKARFAAAKEVVYVPAASNTDRTAGMFFPDPSFFYTNAERGKIPAWTNRMAVMSWEEWLDLDGVAAASGVLQPLLMVHSDGSALPDNARRAYGNARGPKDLFWTEGEHTKFYDDPTHIARAADVVAAHFRRTLPSAEPAGLRAPGTDLERRVTDFFEALEKMDIPRFLALWAEDGVQEMPFAPGDFPERLEGREAIARQYGALPAAFAGMQFTINRMTAGADGRTAIVEFVGSVELKTGGRYDNRYIGVFTYNEAGTIQRFTEYFDPYTLVHGFPGAAAVGAPDTERIITTVNAVARLADERAWDQLRGVFADHVDVDYTSLVGGDPARVPADDLLAGWAKGLAAFARTEHVLTGHNVTVRGDTAECRARFIATHVRGEANGGDRWTVGGHYRYALRKDAGIWKVTGTTMVMEWEQGDR